MTKIRDTIDPKPVRAELKNAAVLFFLDQRQPQRVAIKGNRLVIRVARTFDRDIRSARKLRPFKFGNHRTRLPAFWSAATCRRFQSADVSAHSTSTILRHALTPSRRAGPTWFRHFDRVQRAL